MCSYIYSDSWNYSYFVFILQTVPELWLWFDVPDRFPGVKPDFLYTFQSYIRNPDILRKAIAESDVKEEGGGISVNLNITTGTNEKLEELKKFSIKKQVDPCSLHKC